MPAEPITEIKVRVERLGSVLEPSTAPDEALGVLNPACARTRNGTLLLYPRDVARGNISRIGLVRANPAESFYRFERLGYVLQPEAEYERREHSGYGCEDPRVSYIEALDQYAMTYTAFGPHGPRVAIALSDDGYSWQRMGLLEFDRPGLHIGDDKDAAFFPEPVRSPSGELSLAFYHRPMLHLSAVDGRAAIPLIEQMPFEDRESIRIGYVPLKPVLKNRANITRVSESALALSPDAQWGSLKIGCGTPPVRIEEGWMSLFHAVDVINPTTPKPKFRYCAGIVIHDYERPEVIRYRSPQPVLVPETAAERKGVVDNVVFPTGIDPRRDLGPRTFDVYYGMADYKTGAVRLSFGDTQGGLEPAESAA
ncbi:MAG: glycosidase [Candidatus Meridianibacter frigidus]|nr:MAG: glycosidase [Candidatus Eremiobacteraeota bacterium]